MMVPIFHIINLFINNTEIRVESEFITKKKCVQFSIYSYIVDICQLITMMNIVAILDLKLTQRLGSCPQSVRIVWIGKPSLRSISTF